ncbi:hypothetical protein TNCV_3369621 [Trichonephila clavipes]|uniref:Uncharacterized protein n=1 Tax=Trichonephila clavipes TaxID=2585209 RepID=A0A8X6UXM7_TRICX|nr:hypothetical protein TNCV_3369621 [Trichonephila clavipes]
MLEDSELEKSDIKNSDFPYRQAVGALMYLMNLREVLPPTYQMMLRERPGQGRLKAWTNWAQGFGLVSFSTQP